MFSHKTELYNVLLTIMNRASKIEISGLNTVQDAMINLRIDWETLEAKLRNRKLDGFETVVDTIMQLSATALTMASALQAKILNQREMQMNRIEAEMEEPEQAEETKVTKEEPVKPKRRGRKPKGE